MKEIRFAKFLVFVNGAVPLTLLLWDAFRHGLGANPVNFAIRTTGMLTLVFLFLSLLVTPVRKITGWNWLIFSRRTLGLYAFFYGCTHFLLFYGLDRSLSLASTFSEMLKRKYLFVGITGLLLMVPLAATSTNAMIKRLGGPRWRALHRLVYLAAIAGVLHYYMQVKADVRQPVAFAAVLGLLFGFRLVAYWRRPKAPQVAGVARPKMWSGQLRVERMVQETPEVRTFRLVSPDGGRLSFDYKAGQYLILSLLIDGKKVTRTYTIASSPARPAYCELTIKREEHGLASRHLHDTVREGDLLNVSAPAGRFTFDEAQAKSVVLIAGGVGITPLMAILRYLTDRNWKGEIHFLYCAKTPQDIIFRQELEDLQRRFPNLHLVVTLTRAEALDWPGRKGRIGGDLLRQTIPNLATQPVFICGPASMMEPSIQLLREQGVPGEQIRSEAFLAAKRSDLARPASGVEASPVISPAMAGAPSPDLAIDQSGPPAVTFALSAKWALLSPEKTLLELSEQAGLNLDYECRSGVCGRCKTKLLAGIPAGLPSELLRRRPDVLASEQLLIAANANIGASLANFFPRIGLTTFIGKVSPELSAFTAGSANMWNAGATLAGPLFQGGQLRAQYRGSKAKFDDAKAAYEQNILTALQESSDALIARQKLGEARVYYEQAATALASSVDLATQRYVGGRSSYYEVLQAQQELYPTQRAQVQARVGELIAVIQLYKALGGGWQGRDF